MSDVLDEKNVVEAVEAIVELPVDTVKNVATTVNVPVLKKRIFKNFTLEEGIAGLTLVGAGAGIAEGVRFVIRKKPVTRFVGVIRSFLDFRRKEHEIDQTDTGSQEVKVADNTADTAESKES